MFNLFTNTLIICSTILFFSLLVSFIYYLFLSLIKKKEEEKFNDTKILNRFLKKEKDSNFIYFVMDSLYCLKDGSIIQLNNTIYKMKDNQINRELILSELSDEYIKDIILSEIAKYIPISFYSFLEDCRIEYFRDTDLNKSSLSVSQIIDKIYLYRILS